MSESILMRSNFHANVTCPPVNYVREPKFDVVDTSFSHGSARTVFAIRCFFRDASITKSFENLSLFVAERYTPRLSSCIGSYSASETGLLEH